MKERYLPAFNHEFKQLPLEDGSAFVPFCGKSLDDILCEQFERTVGNDNCVHFERMTLQIPANPYRMHYVKVRVRVHRYSNGRLAVFHGPRKLADYDENGLLLDSKTYAAA